MTPETYFSLHNLYDADTLAQHCEQNGVYLITSPRFPGLILLHYNANEVHFADKWTTFNRMCRGLIVDLVNKRIVAHPFDKFFNLGEKPETQYDALLARGTFEVSEKLDGSMILIFQNPNTGLFHATTKGSFDSDHGIYATSILPDVLKDKTLHETYTLIFELISKKFQIVVDYTKKGYPEGLYLIGARHRQSGKLLTFDEVHELGRQLGLPTMKTYQFSSLDQLIETTNTLPVLDEGYVLRFSDELLVKVKGAKYLEAHRFISHLSRRSILEALGTGTAKELCDIAPEEYRDDVKSEIAFFEKHKIVLVDECHEHFNRAPKDGRKEFALWVAQNVPAELKAFMFMLFDHKPLDNKKVYSLIGVREGVTGETKI